MNEWLENIAILNGLFLILIAIIFVLFGIRRRELHEWQVELEQREMAQNGQMSASEKEMQALCEIWREEVQNEDAS